MSGQGHEVADDIGRAVAQALHSLQNVPVRPPSHTCPPVFAVDLDVGIQPQAPGYAVVAPGASLTVERMVITQGYYGVCIGFAWTVAFDTMNPADPYLTTPMSLLIDGQAHRTYRNVRRQLSGSLAALQPITVPLKPPGPGRSTQIALAVTNEHGSASIRVAARLRGYEFPVHGTAQGIDAGLVAG